MVRDRGVHRCVSGHIRGGWEDVTRAGGNRQAGRLGSAFGKDLLYGVQGREVTVDEARAVVKHPLPISPSRSRFALFRLCKAGAVQLGSFAASRALTSLFILTPSSAARSASAR